MSTFVWIILSISAVTVVFFNASGKLEDDSVIEEMIEEGIEQVSGLDIDLSPNSDEK